MGNDVMGAARVSNRERVRTLLIEPLTEDGMVRHPRTKATDHAAFLEKLAARLGWMSDDNLRRLRRILFALATGKARNIWPAWVTVWNHAVGLQAPPDPKNPIMQTWLHSRRGPELREAGTLVETYLFLRQHGRPPSKFDEAKIAERSREAARRRHVVADKIKTGRASEDERRWLAWYGRIEALCDDIVEAGIRHREAVQ